MNSSSRALAFATLAITTLGWSTAASGAVTLTLSDAEIFAGGTTVLPVSIESSSASPQPLSLFSVQWLLAPSSATPGTSLQFVQPQSEGFLGESDYVFVGNSSGLINNLQAALVTSTNVVADTLILADNSNDFTDEPISGSRLLGWLELSHQLPPGTSPLSVEGDEFDLTLVSGLFADSLGQPVAFTGGNARITIRAIPEPSSTAVLSVAAALAVGWRPRRRRNRQFLENGAKLGALATNRPDW